MARRPVLAAVLASALLLAGIAAGDPGTDKARLDARIGDLRDRAAQATQAEGLLTTELSALDARVRAAEAAVSVEQARLDALEASLAAERARLAALEQKIAVETARLVVLRRQYAVALARAREAPPGDLRVRRAGRRSPSRSARPRSRSCSTTTTS